MQKKLNKNKIIVLVAIIMLTIICLICFGRNKNIEEKMIVTISENQFENIEAKDIQIIYDETTKQTAVKFVVKNKTNSDITDQAINVILLNKDNRPIASIYSYMDLVQAQGEYTLDALVDGDLSNTTQICLQKPETFE